MCQGVGGALGERRWGKGGEARVWSGEGPREPRKGRKEGGRARLREGLR